VNFNETKFRVLFFLTIVAAAVTASCGTTMSKSKASSSFAEVIPKKRTLAVGAMQIYDFGSLRLHAYQTNDPMKDECFLLETGRELIGIETPAFSRNLTEYANYVKSLGKPLNHLILVNHGNGGKMFKNVRVYTTASVQAAFQEGGHSKDLIDNFILEFGADFNGDIPEATDIIQAGKVVIGGVDFTVVEKKEGFDLEIPAINSVYTHMAGSHTHNILPGIEAIEDMARRMKHFQVKNFALILSSHETPEPYAVLAEKIRYLERTKVLIRSSQTKEDFIAAMNEAFPDYAGENYLEMSAGALFN